MTNIRFFLETDTEQVADLLTDMSRHYNGEHASPRSRVRENLITNILGKDSGVRMVVALEADLVVGIAMISLLYPAPKERAQLFMKELYVASTHRSAGIGRALMAWIARYALEKNCARFDWTVDADNEKALAFYQSLGAMHVSDKLYFRLSGDALMNLA